MEQLAISMALNSDGTVRNITTGGATRRIVTDEDLNSWGLNSQVLKALANGAMGSTPVQLPVVGTVGGVADVFVRSPTPWNDLYTTYGWQQVSMILEPVKAEVVSFASEPQIVATNNYNNRGSAPMTTHASAKQQVTNTVESNWSTSNSLKIGTEISVSIQGIAESRVSMEWQGTWSEGGSRSQAVTLEVDTGADYVVQPGQSARVVISASRGTLRVRVTYKARLEGCLALNYSPPFNGHHFYATDLPSAMNKAGRPTEMFITQDLTFNFFSDAQSEVIDSTTGNRIADTRSGGSTAPIPSGSSAAQDKIQDNWRYCSKCSGLRHGGKGGVCPAGGSHADAGGSFNYRLAYDASAATGQDNWRYCDKCAGLRHGGKAGVCPAGGSHADANASFNYCLPHDQPSGAGQDNWRYCDKCAGLRHGSNAGVCPAGGSHADSNASYNYRLAH